MFDQALEDCDQVKFLVGEKGYFTVNVSLSFLVLLSSSSLNFIKNTLFCARILFVRRSHDESLRFCKLARSYSQSMVEKVKALDIMDPVMAPRITAHARRKADEIERAAVAERKRKSAEAPRVQKILNDFESMTHREVSIYHL